MLLYDGGCLVCYIFYWRSYNRRLRILDLERKAETLSQIQQKMVPLVDYKYLKENVGDKLQSDYSDLYETGLKFVERAQEAGSEVWDLSKKEYQDLIQKMSEDLDIEEGVLRKVSTDEIIEIGREVARGDISKAQLKEICKEKIQKRMTKEKQWARGRLDGIEKFGRQKKDEV
jgi:hypothetical protein